MVCGLLWHDSDKGKSVEEKIRTAAKYYAHKYGHPANTVVVNIDLDAPLKVDEILVKKSRGIVVNHFWVGLD